MSNLLKDASILLTPTAYDNGRMLSIKPSKDLYGPELITNGDFSNGSNDWVIESTWTVANELASGNGANGGSQEIKQTNVLTVGKNYKITYEVKNWVSGSVKESHGAYYSQDGVYTEYITATRHQVIFRGDNFIGDITNVGVKEDLSGDMYFSRNSAATRVNAQGLVENVQILSSNLVQNGDFSEEGSEEVSNGSFSQEGVQLVTNGSFDTDTDWTKGTGWSISGGTANCDGTQTVSTGLNNSSSNGLINNKFYKITYTISNYVSGSIRIKAGNTGYGVYHSSNGTYTQYIKAQVTTFPYAQFNADADFIGSIDNVSVKEVGQDWTLGTGWSIGEGEAINDGTINAIYTQKAIQQGKKYVCKVDITFQGAGVAYWRLGNTTNLGVMSVDGTITQTLTGSANGNYIGIFANTAITITNISVKEVGQNWTFGDGFTPDQANSKATCDGTQSAATNLTQTISTNIQNKLVRVSFTLDYTAGVLLGSLSGTGAVDFNNITSSGTYTAEMTSNEVSPPLILQGDANFIGSITNIVLLEITNDTNLPRINYEGFSYQDSLGSEEIVNGDFSNGLTNWTTYGNTSVSNGIATIGASSNSGIFQGILIQNKSYKVTINVTSYNGVGIAQVISDNGTPLYTITDTGEQSFIFKHTINISNFIIRGLSNAIFSIDNVSVKEYLGQEVVPDSGCGSWLLEDESTNLIPYSEDFSSLNIINNAVVTSNQIISPSGLLDADEITFDGTLYGRVEASLSVTNGATYTISVYLKNKDLSDVTQVWIGFSQTGQGQFITITDEWQRYEITLAANGTTEYPRIQFSGSGSLYAWGFQTEQQSYATSYIPTSGASSTRLRDLASDSGNATLINSTEGTLYAEIVALANYNLQRWISLSDGTHNNTIKIGILNSATDYKIAADVRVGGVNQAFLAYNFGAVAPTFKKCAIKYKQNDFALWIDGVEVATDTSGNTPIGLNELTFTRGDGGQKFEGKQKALAVYKEALTDAELTSLTTI